MQLDCPACGKTNDSSNDANCLRCGCDLAKLAEILQATLAHLAASVQALQDRQWPEALRHAELGWSLRNSPAAARLAFLAAAALGDTPRAVRWWRTANESTPSP